jgi:hypothetical protein
MGILWIIIVEFVAGIIAWVLSPGPNKPAGFVHCCRVCLPQRLPEPAPSNLSKSPIVCSWFSRHCGAAREFGWRCRAVASRPGRMVASRVLFVFSSPHALPHGVLLAHVGALLGRSVVLGAAEVIYFRLEIGPDNRVGWAAGLGLRLSRELVRSRRSRCRRGSRLDGWRRGGCYSGFGGPAVGLGAGPAGAGAGLAAAGVAAGAAGALRAWHWSTYAVSLIPFA